FIIASTKRIGLSALRSSNHWRGGNGSPSSEKGMAPFLERRISAHTLPALLGTTVLGSYESAWMATIVCISTSVRVLVFELSRLYATKFWNRRPGTNESGGLYHKADPAT